MQFKRTKSLIATLFSFGIFTSAFAGAFTYYQVNPNQLGWYLKGFGGATLTPTWHFRDPTTLNKFSVNYSTAGFDGGFSVGYAYGPFRWEGQFTYMRTNYKHVRDNTGAIIPGETGSTQLFVLMGNIMYAFQQLSQDVTPYLGAGIGGAPRFQSTHIGSGNAVAAQGILGIDFTIEGDSTIGFEYRYFSTIGTPFGSGDFVNQIINLTLTYFFDP